MRERAEVAGAVVLFDSGELDAGEGVVEVDFDEEEFFVVAEADVVAGAVFLDELAFEEEGSLLTVWASRSQMLSRRAWVLRSARCWREGWKYWLTRLLRSRALPT
jgi:hypothetical protein